MVDLRIWTGEASLEWRVQEAELLPVRVKSSDVVTIETWVKITAFQRCQNSTNAWLGSHATHAV